jgi:hypothetical protein
MKQQPMAKEEDPRKKYSDLEIFNMIQIHLADYAMMQPFCIAKEGGALPMKCSCMLAFEDASTYASVAGFLMDFGKLKLDQQQEKIIKWLRYYEGFLHTTQGKKTRSNPA